MPISGGDLRAFLSKVEATGEEVWFSVFTNSCYQMLSHAIPVNQTSLPNTSTGRLAQLEP